MISDFPIPIRQKGIRITLPEVAHVVKSVDIPVEVAEAFGLSAKGLRVRVVPRATVELAGVMFITGPSGAGKSTVLRLFAEAIPDCAVLSSGWTGDGASVLRAITEIGLSVNQAIRILTDCGLGEPSLMVRAYDTLSTGQQARARIALLLARKASVTLVDELGSGLDDRTAEIIAYNLQRIIRRQNGCLIAASSKANLTQALGPDAVLTVTANARLRLRHPTREPRIGFMQHVRSIPGRRRDADALAAFHYKKVEMPESEWGTARITAARLDRATIGVSIYVLPIPKAFGSNSLFDLLNATVLTKWRLIVHPQYRGIGITRFLEPLDPRGIEIVTVVSALEVFAPFSQYRDYVETHDPLTICKPEQIELGQLLKEALRDDGAGQPIEYIEESIWQQLPEAVKTRAILLARQILIAEEADYIIFLADLLGCEMPQRDRLRRELHRYFRLYFAKLSTPPSAYIRRAVYKSRRSFARRIGSPTASRIVRGISDVQICG